MLSCNYDREKRGYNSDKKLLSLFILKKEKVIISPNFTPSFLFLLQVVRPQSIRRDRQNLYFQNPKDYFYSGKTLPKYRFQSQTKVSFHFFR